MKVYEIFKSVSGEPCHLMQGRVCGFVRFSGCNLRCSYCDTSHVQTEKEAIELSPIEIANRIRKMNVDFCILTGGEPLLQSKPDIITLIKRLGEENIEVGIETNGSVAVYEFSDFIVQHMIDYKLPGSGMEDAMHKDNFFKRIPGVPEPIFKFVCSNIEDYERAIEVKRQMDVFHVRPSYVFTGTTHDLTQAIASRLINGGKETKGCIIYQQLHKVLGLA